MTVEADRGVLVERHGPVTVATIDRQHVRNAFDPAALLTLAAVFRSTDATYAGTRAIVFTGAGTASFCAGMDLKSLRGCPREEVSAAIAAFDAAIDAIDRPVIIAAVNGPATGGGFEILSRVDLVVAAEEAEFRLPEVQRGLVPGGGATLLPSRIPLAVALEIVLLGEPISARRAYDLGLVNRVVPRADVLSVAMDIATRIAAHGPRAVARSRQLLRLTASEGAAVGWAATRARPDDPELEAETAEGIAAFNEKRPPRWAS